MTPDDLAKANQEAAASVTQANLDALPFLCPLCPFPLPVQGPYPHTWERNRWSAAQWPSHYAMPRTCGGCGGVHPEDVLRMLAEGWTEEKADGGDKGYLSAPGYKAELNAWLKASNQRNALGIGDQGLKAFPADPIPAPPVKFYVGHFDQAQLARLNQLHLARKAKP